ncbi:hypothetical protein [Fodinicola feengrottensis]|uniref:hypothetical protein n=1 Tax=Fodinicola feengrottensis TaxID=435914 RepID=UPI002441B3C5|nr:hypothetical protein [Fodinicola feengrottensis]
MQRQQRAVLNDRRHDPNLHPNAHQPAVPADADRHADMQRRDTYPYAHSNPTPSGRRRRHP